MKHLKQFENLQKDPWQTIQESLDVYQLYELLVYGKIFTDTKEAIDEYEGDYNPDEIYEIIEYELKAKNIWEDFLENYERYEIEKDEADPFHWRNRLKRQEEFEKTFRDSLDQ
jgi:hypothetical protein